MPKFGEDFTKKSILSKRKKTENQENVSYKLFFVGTKQVGVDDLEVSKA